MMDIMFYILVATALGSFFCALFQRDPKNAPLAIFLYVFAAVFFFISALGSVSIDIMVGNTITSYGGNAIFGFVFIALGIISAVSVVNRLPELFK